MARAGTARVPVEEGSAVMQTDVVRALLAALAWLAVTLGVYVIVKAVLPDALREGLSEIHAAFAKKGAEKLAPAFSHLKGAYSYDDLSLARILYRG